MSWRVVFTGAIALLAAVLVGVIAILLRDRYPWLSGVTVFADIGIIIAGLKSVLDTTKTANELRKMGLEIEKLKFEIEEKKKAAEKENSRIVVATLDDIQTYSRQIGSPQLPRNGRGIYGGTVALIAVSFIGLLGYFVRQSHESPSGSAPPGAESVSPSLPDSDEGEAPTLEVLASRAQTVNVALDGMKRRSLDKRNRIVPWAVVDRRQKEMNRDIAEARRARSMDEPDQARIFETLARDQVMFLEQYIQRASESK